jgi:hypothetical protein
METIELYPHIFVYKNLFKDISKSYKVLTDSLEDSEDRIFNPWTQWSIFGEYLNPVIPSFSTKTKYGNFENVEATTENQKAQKDLGLELHENFHLVSEDYIKRYGIDVDLEDTSIDEFGKVIPTWRYSAGSISRYHVSDENAKIGMNYHSDYMREDAESPGYKFVITCTVYFNDDYEGGEVDFSMGNKLIKYKPEAGDILMFPSGHPDYLTEEGKPYLHGVMPAYKKNKYLARMYWQKYQRGSDDWYAKEKEFGKEVWAGMQKDLHEQFRKDHPQRSHIENAVRIK